MTAHRPTPSCLDRRKPAFLALTLFAAASVAACDSGEQSGEVGPTERLVCEAGAQLALAPAPVSVRGDIVLTTHALDIAPAELHDAAGPLAVRAIDLATGFRVRGGVTADGAFDLELMPGRYELQVAFAQPWCSGVCAHVTVDAELVVAPAMAPLDLEVGLVPVDVTLWLDGDAVPPSDALTERGFFALVDRETGRTFRQELPADGPAAALLWVPDNRDYDAFWTTEQRVRQGHGEPARALPVGSYALGLIEAHSGTVYATGQRCSWGETETGGLRVSLSSVLTSLRVQVAGRDLADDGILDGESRGYVRSWSTQGPGGAFEVDLGESGDAVVALRVFWGEYEAMLFGGEQSGQDAVEAGFYRASCGQDLGGSGCTFFAGQELVWDFMDPDGEGAKADVTGTVAIAMVTEPGRCVELTSPTCGDMEVQFVHRELGAVTGRATATDGVFETRLRPGSYDVWLVGGFGSCAQGAALAQQGLVVGAPELVSPEAAPEPLHIALSSAAFSTVVEVTMGGAEMPSDAPIDGEPRGALSFRSLDRPGIVSAPVPLGESGPAVSEQLLLAGNYEASLSTMTLVGKDLPTPYAQSVLPVGDRVLGELRVGGIPSETVFDVSVARLSGSVDLGALTVASTLPARVQDAAGVMLVSQATGAHTLLVESVGEPGLERTYAGLAYRGAAYDVWLSYFDGYVPLSVSVVAEDIVVGCDD